MDKKDMGTTSTGMPANVAALLSYAFGWITGLIFFFLEKKNAFIRFHAMQSMIVFAAVIILQLFLSLFMTALSMIRMGGFVPFLILVSNLVTLAAVVLWVLLMVKAYQGERFKLPVAGDWAERAITV